MAQFILKPSCSLCIMLLVAHLCAAALLLHLQLSAITKLLLCIAVCASLLRSLSRHALLKSASAIVAAQVADRESALVQMRHGNWREAEILGTSYVSPLLTVLNLRLRGCVVAQHIVIVSDNIDAEDYRQLRVILRWKQRSPLKVHDTDRV